MREGDDTVSFHTNLNSTHIGDFPHTPHPPEPHPVLPATPWHHTQHWVAIDNQVKAAESAPRPGTLLGEHIAVATSPPTHLWQARLEAGAKPYPGSHRNQGVEVVPASVLLQTLSVAAAEFDASILSDVQLKYPIAIDQPRVIQVVADGESVTVSSSPATADSATQRWVRHASARILSRSRNDEPAGSEGAEGAEGLEGTRNGGEHEMPSVAELAAGMRH